MGKSEHDELANFIVSQGRFGECSDRASEICQAITDFEILDGLYSFENILAIRTEGGARLSDMLTAIIIRKTVRAIADQDTRKTEHIITIHTPDAPTFNKRQMPPREN